MRCVSQDTFKQQHLREELVHSLTAHGPGETAGDSYRARGG